jgi:hypothetical protein
LSFLLTKPRPSLHWHRLGGGELSMASADIISLMGRWPLTAVDRDNTSGNECLRWSRWLARAPMPSIFHPGILEVIIASRLDTLMRIQILLRGQMRHPNYTATIRSYTFRWVQRIVEEVLEHSGRSPWRRTGPALLFLDNKCEQLVDSQVTGTLKYSKLSK